MYADPRSIFTAAWLFRIRAVHYCIICPYLGRGREILTLLTASRCTRDDMNCRSKDNSDVDVRYFRINKEKSLIFSQDICGSEQNILVLSGVEQRSVTQHTCYALKLWPLTRPIRGQDGSVWANQRPHTRSRLNDNKVTTRADPGSPNSPTTVGHFRLRPRALWWCWPSLKFNHNKTRDSW